MFCTRAPVCLARDRGASFYGDASHTYRSHAAIWQVQNESENGGHSGRPGKFCIISFYIMAGHFRSDSTATFDTLLDTVHRPSRRFSTRLYGPVTAGAPACSRPRPALCTPAHLPCCMRRPRSATCAPPQYLPALPPCARAPAAGAPTAVVSRYTLSLLHEYGGTDGHSWVFVTLSGSCEMVEPV